VVTSRQDAVSPRLLPPPSELPVLDVASPPSTLTLRACLRVAEVAARAGRGCALLPLVLLWPPSLSGSLGLRSSPGAGRSTPEAHAAPRGVWREGGRARVVGRRARGRAGARGGKEAGAAGQPRAGRPGDVDA
jgi:hypothetical protein